MKSYKGITLVALIITIAVLIIITAVSIKAFGDSENGIIAKAKKASKDYIQSETQEKDTLKNILDQINEEDKEKEEEIKKEKLLPDEYQGVEYIESTGTQYIDTGYIPNSNTKIDTDFMYKNLSETSSVFGIRVEDGTTRQFLQSITAQGALWFVNGLNNTTNYTFELNQLINIKHSIIMEQTGSYLDENLIHINTKDVVDGIDSVLYIFGRKTQLGFANAFIGKIYIFKIYDSNKLARNFIPCYRKSDNVIGMYDTVEGKFYTNQGTGTFLKGADVDYEKE